MYRYIMFVGTKGFLMPYVAKAEDVCALIERKMGENRTPDNPRGHDPWILHEVSSELYETGGEAKRSAKKKYGDSYHLPKEQSWDIYISHQLTDAKVPAVLIPLFIAAISHQDEAKIQVLRTVCDWCWQEEERQSVSDLAKVGDYLFQLDRLIYGHLRLFRPPPPTPDPSASWRCKTCDSIGPGDCERRQFAGEC